ncbi:ABC-type transport auxiliary lipoprotein family protein [Oxalobacteraceae bacterium R-40]|uniref:ABC-type transport auxiliary lipoprotein family protein n=1 Tax=Keguizhuia sedimenti TaxID=3064264 RepID=A0ABU1BJJ0_9BURK|nr:ABC-type transport auxiliary lipoprotein family protein [Oxalobacteraceae bacterium R-40]
MMKNFISLALLFLALSGCAVSEPPPRSQAYDLGPLSRKHAADAPRLPALSVAHIDAPSWLDSTRMFYRLAYANEQQPRQYSGSRWITPPAQLFEQRLKSWIGQEGNMVLSASAGAMRVPVLQIEVDEFTQIFESPAQSAAHVTVRAAVIQNRILIAQQTFTKQVPAPTADAPGGVRALADASDAVIADMMRWLAQLPLKK